MVQIRNVVANVVLDQNPRRKQIFSKTLVETKRLSRTLPAVINGLSASQAQVQGFVEDITDADSASTANSEPLFVEGGFTEKIEPRPRSVSPIETDDINGDAPELNPAAASFNPSNAPNPGLFNNLSPSQTLTFGKPSISPFASTKQMGTTSPFSPISNSTDQAIPSTQRDDDDSSKLNPFARKIANVPGEKTRKTTSIAGKEPPMFDLAKRSENSYGLDVDNKKIDSPFARSSNVDFGIFGQAQKTNPLNLATSENISSQSPRGATGATASAPSIFDQPSKSLASPKFSFGTSPLFQNIAAKQTETNTENAPLKFNSDTSKSPLFTNNPNPFVPSSDPLAPPQSSTHPGTLPSVNVDKPTSVGFSSKIHNAKLCPPSLGHPEISTSGVTPAPSNPTAKASFQPTLSNSPPESKQTANFPSPTIGDSFEPKAIPPTPLVLGQTSRPQNTPSNLPQSAFDSQHASNTLNLPVSAVSQSRKDVQTIANKQTVSRPTILDQLSDAVMLENHGLLQQFVEFIVEPMIKSSIAQLEDEDSWKDASEFQLRFTWDQKHILN